MTEFKYSTIGGREEGLATPRDVEKILREMLARPTWDSIRVQPNDTQKPDGIAQYPFLNLSWHPEYGYEIQCFEHSGSNSFFLSAKQGMSSPEVYVEIGGQTQELWPIELFVPLAVATQAARYFLEFGGQDPGLHWTPIEKFPRRTVKPRNRGDSL